MNPDAMRRLTVLPHASVSTVVAGVLAGNANAQRSAEDLRAAAMLHTDAAIELLELAHVEHAVFHLNTASRLVDATLGISALDSAYGARWYALSVALLEMYGVHPWAGEFRKRSAARFFRNPSRTALTSAIQDERRASGIVRLSRADHVGEVAGVDVRLVMRFKRVAQAFEKVVRLDPQCHEAWLHLGRARMIVNEYDRATSALEKASLAADPRHRYLALMFLGAIAELKEEFALAERRYVDASRAYPWGQSAPLALSHLLSRIGQEAKAREILEDHLSRSRRLIAEPLWTYMLDPPASMTLNELRATVWR
jgi:tetratricopeptide (TPR) repeat protein